MKEINKELLEKLKNLESPIVSRPQSGNRRANDHIMDEDSILRASINENKPTSEFLIRQSLQTQNLGDNSSVLEVKVIP